MAHPPRPRRARTPPTRAAVLRRATLAALLLACVPSTGGASTGAGRLQLRSGVAAPPSGRFDFGPTRSVGLAFAREVLEWVEAEGAASWARASASQSLAVPADSDQPLSSRVTWIRLEQTLEARTVGAGVRLRIPERLAGHLQLRPYLAAGLDATYASLVWWPAGQRAHASGWGAGWHVGLGGELDLGAGWSMGLEGRWSWSSLSLRRREAVSSVWAQPPQVGLGGGALLVGVGWRL